MVRSRVQPFLDVLPIKTSRTYIRLLNKRDCKWYAEEIHKEYYTEYNDNKVALSMSTDTIKSRLYSLIDGVRCSKLFKYELRTVAINRETNEPCGGVTIHPTAYDGLVEISYWIKPKYQRLGLGTEIVRAVVKELFKINDLREIKIVIQSVNIASITVAEKLGARFMREEPGVYCTNFVYRLRK